MLDQAQRTEVEAIGSMQEKPLYPPIWDQIDRINAKPSELGLKHELSNMVRVNSQERLEIPEHRWFRKLKQKLGLNL